MLKRLILDYLAIPSQVLISYFLREQVLERFDSIKTMSNVGPINIRNQTISLEQ
jgi:hypothetical protein